MRAILLPLLLAALAPGLASAAQARPDTARRAAVLDALSACRKEADGPARLACYDRAAGALDEAEARGQVVVLDREQVKTVRRQAFGLELPAFSLFSGRGGVTAEDKVDRVSYTLRRAELLATRKWLFVMDEGSSWIQTDEEEIRIPPRPGVQMAVRRGALNSYFCNIEGQRGVRCTRNR